MTSKKELTEPTQADLNAWYKHKSNKEKWIEEQENNQEPSKEELTEEEILVKNLLYNIRNLPDDLAIGEIKGFYNEIKQAGYERGIKATLEAIKPTLPPMEYIKRGVLIVPPAKIGLSLEPLYKTLLSLSQLTPKEQDE